MFFQGSIHRFLLLIPWWRNPHFLALQDSQSVRLDTAKCHWSFETFLPFNTWVCVCVCVSRWSVKERWAAVGPALLARTMSLCLMSTLAEPVSLAPGLQMTSLVNTLCLCLCYLQIQDFQQGQWSCKCGSHTDGAPKIPLHTTQTTQHCEEISTNTHVLYPHQVTSGPCQETGFDWGLDFLTTKSTKIETISFYLMNTYSVPLCNI